MLPKEGSINCCCGDNTDDGRAVLCEKCKTWQHEHCVNITQFSEPERYICAKCRGICIACPCNEENNYKKALICCSICHKYFHKRHVGVGFGQSPSNFICPICSVGAYKFVETLVSPIPSFLPKYNVEINVLPIKECFPSVPIGPLRSLLEKIPKKSSAASITAFIYSNFRSVLFSAHPTVLRFKFPNEKPLTHNQIVERAENSWNFAVIMIRAIAAMTRLTTTDILQILDHIISVDIYKKPMPDCFRIPKDMLCDIPSCGKDDAYKFSERSDDNFLDEKPKFKYERLRRFGSHKVSITDGTNGMPTVVADEDIKVGDMICFAYGNVVMLEEADRDSVPPSYEMIRISSTNMILDGTKLKEHGLFQRIRRGFVSNCELRAFDIGGERYLGIFATRPTPMSLLSQKKLLEHNDIIKAGEELVLPFDLPPSCINRDTKWCIYPPEKILMHASELVKKYEKEAEEETPVVEDKPEKENDFSLLKNLLGNDTKVYVKIKGNTKPTSLFKEGMPVHVAHFAPPGKKTWTKVPVEQVKIKQPEQWFNTKTDDQKDSDTYRTSNIEKEHPAPIAFWDDSSDDDDYTGIIDVSEKYLAKTLTQKQ